MFEALPSTPRPAACFAPGERPGRDAQQDRFDHMDDHTVDPNPAEAPPDRGAPIASEALEPMSRVDHVLGLDGELIFRARQSFLPNLCGSFADAALHAIEKTIHGSSPRDARC